MVIHQVKSQLRQQTRLLFAIRKIAACTSGQRRARIVGIVLLLGLIGNGKLRGSDEDAAQFRSVVSEWQETLVGGLNILKKVHKDASLPDIKKQLLDAESVYDAAWRRVAKFPPLSFEKERLELSPKTLALNASIFVEYKRLHNAGQLQSLSTFFPISYLDEQYRRGAEGEITVIDLYVSLVMQHEDLVPKSLSVMTKPINHSQPLMKIDQLKDPWGREYQFDYRGIRNEGKKPDVWSLGPLHGGTRDKTIANWNLPKQ